MRQPKVHPVKHVRAVSNDAGTSALMGFERADPDETGSDELWIEIPVDQLPQVALSALSAIPDPQARPGYRNARTFRVQELWFGQSDDGKLVVEMGFAPGASLSVRIDETQARKLVKGIRDRVPDCD